MKIAPGGDAYKPSSMTSERVGALQARACVVFQSTDEGWQSRMDDALRGHVRNTGGMVCKQTACCRQSLDHLMLY
jgi:hypothetical protein